MKYYVDCVVKTAGRHFEAAYCVIECAYSREDNYATKFSWYMSVYYYSKVFPLLHLNYIKMFLFYVGYIVAK